MFIIITAQGTPLATFDRLDDAQHFRNTATGTWGATIWQLTADNHNPTTDPDPGLLMPRRRQ